jgi:lysine 2,3-aminomutase
MEMLKKNNTKRESDRPAGLRSAEPKPKGYIPGELLTIDDYSMERFLSECEGFLYPLKGCQTLDNARDTLRDRTMGLRVESTGDENKPWHRTIARTRDCTRAFLSMLSSKSEDDSGFSVARALWDVARDIPRPDLEPGFFAEMIHLVWGLEGRTMDQPVFGRESTIVIYEGRKAARRRSRELDALREGVCSWIGRYSHGLEPETRKRRIIRRDEILDALGARQADWNDWKWHVEHVGNNADILKKLVNLSALEEDNIRRTCKSRIPFGVTPFYLSLMDTDGKNRDLAVRMQVFPPVRYVDKMVADRQNREEAFDFMGEADTSPIDLITRRYPSIAILKPFNTCPQICVYCQRNWEIDEVLAPDAMASWEKIDAAIEWLGNHPAIHEVLITGGDPLLLEDDDLDKLLGKVTALPSIRRIRIGTRTPVTLPMRFTDELASLLGKYRTRNMEVAIVTHVEHPYEMNEDMADAVEKVRRHGIPMYNQLVYTFYVSRRFEASLLRQLLKQVGIDPYYTFLPKGKSETADYRIPLSRLLQEESEEARLMPGMTRTDEAVYNVPRLGKNYLRASQHRDILTIKADGTRVYEFHPWEKNIVDQGSYVGEIVPIYEYLRRLEVERGCNPWDYESIWYYF